MTEPGGKKKKGETSLSDLRIIFLPHHSSFLFLPERIMGICFGTHRVFCKCVWLRIELCVQPLWFERNCIFQNKARRAEKGETQLYEAPCPSSGCGGSPTLQLLVSCLLCLQQLPNCFFLKVGATLGEFLPYSCWLCLAKFLRIFFSCL